MLGYICAGICRVSSKVVFPKFNTNYLSLFYKIAEFREVDEIVCFGRKEHVEEEKDTCDCEKESPERNALARPVVLWVVPLVLIVYLKFEKIIRIIFVLLVVIVFF